MPSATAAEVRAARRIVLHGVTGSGKSTAAARLAERLDLPLHLADDEIGFLPATTAPWTNRRPADMRRLAADLAGGERWVLDSTYGAFRDVVLARCQVVVWLDLSRPRTFARLVRRTARRVRTGELVCGGNVETVRRAVSADSILWWHARSFARKRRLGRALAAAPDGPGVYRVRVPADLRRLLAGLAQRRDTSR